MVIWKFEMPMVSAPVLSMPVGAEIVHVGLDPDRCYSVWAMVNPTAPVESRRLRLLMTGEPFTTAPDADVVHLGTFVDGPLVVHVFEAAGIS